VSPTRAIARGDNTVRDSANGRTALENVPVAARGICSGILQQGYSFGYLLAAVINLGTSYIPMPR
jgi:hypothetical protein